jgi:integrase
MINQDLLFGSSEKVFKTSTFLSKANEDKKRKDFKFTEAKKYFLSYFAKTMGSIKLYYVPESKGEGKIESLEVKETKAIFDQIPVINYRKNNNDDEDKNDSDEKEGYKFDIKKWFINKHHTTYAINSDPRASRFYEDKKTEQKYINLSKGFLHKKIKKFDDYPTEIKDNVEKINNHICKIWNSSNKDAYEYCLNWFACAFTGHKMETAIFLKSAEGVGKSIFVDFIIEHVIGSDIGMMTAKVNQMLKFNYQLLGKIFVCLEELPSASKSEWHSLSDILKDLITNANMDVERKYFDAMKVANYISLMIFTNNDNTIKFGKDIRRYFMADVSHESVGDLNYYKDLKDAMTRETGEAYFMFLLERYESIKDKFNCADIPLTESKIEMKINNLTQVLKGVKEMFLRNGQGIKDTETKSGHYEVSKLKSEIELLNNYKFKSTQSFTSSLRTDLPILNIEAYGKNKTQHIKPISFDDLLKFYKTKGFWSDKYDKIETEDKTNNDIEDIESRRFNETYKKLYLDAMKEIDDLKQKIKLLEEARTEKNNSEIESNKNKSSQIVDELEKDLMDLEMKGEQERKVIQVEEKKKMPEKVQIVIDSEDEDDEDEINFVGDKTNNIKSFFK